MFDDIASMFSDIAVGISQAFGGPFVAGQIISNGALEYDDGGSIVPGSGQPSVRDCMLQVDAVTEGMRTTAGYTEKDQRILVLASTLTGAIDTDHRVNVIDGPFAGIWMIDMVGRDPCAVYHELRGRPA